MIPARKTTPTVSTSTRLCPNGCGRLTPFVDGALKLDRCATCAGIYLDKELVDRLRRMPTAQLARIDKVIVPSSRAASEKARHHVDPRPCPNCRTLMLPYEVQCHVVVTLDKCGSCEGIWADDRELEAVSVDEGDNDVHFGRTFSDSARDEIVRALYEDSAPHREANFVEEAFAEMFPTFASWVRRTPESSSDDVTAHTPSEEGARS